MPGMSLQEMLTLPWTWHGPERVVDADGARWELTIVELRDFYLVGKDKNDLLRQAFPALVAYLKSYSDRGQNPPVPKRLRSWQVTPPQRGKSPRVAEPAPELQPA